MLNLSQKLTLEELTNNCPFPELKNILQKSIPKWISGEIRPKRFYIGLSVSNDEFVCNGKAACLIGTALIGEKATSIFTACEKLFNIDKNTCRKIMDGFDGKSNSGIEIQNYVNKISEVIFN